MRGSINGFLSEARLNEMRAAIPERYSARQFSAPPSPAQLAALSFLSGRLCLSGVRIRLCECDSQFFTPRLLPSMTITGAEKYALLTYNESVNPLALFCAGFSGQAFALCAWAQGVKSCWADGSFRRERIALPIENGERVAAVLAIGQTETQRRSAIKRKTAAQLVRDDFTAYPLWAQSALEGVRLSPSSMNRQPWQLEFDGEALNIYVKNDAMLELGIAVAQAQAMLPAGGTWKIDAEKRMAAVKLDG
ncbi:MAG: nitroreductase family protein [Eubacteriales bacterium]|nr:nitroreductase family protein [Eubacteriales bacterium]MDD3881426.1 nitroreductase family protein [Eubacteriales bacterium]